MNGIIAQANLLFVASFALSLFMAVALMTVSRTSPAFKGTKWLSGAYLFGAIASGLRLLHPPFDEALLIYLSNTAVLLVYVLLHHALLRVVRPGGTRPWVGITALVLQVALGPLFIYEGDAYHSRGLLIALLVSATILHICYLVVRQGMRGSDETISHGMKSAALSMVVILCVNMIFSMARGLLLGQRSVPLSELATQVVNTANMVVTIVCAVGILLSFLWMTAERLQRELEAQARQDGLTGLLNRRALEEEFEREAQRSERSNQPLALLMLDLDHFKFINDLYGHYAGDLVLCEVALALRQTLRRVDLVARIGGEEFVALLPETSQAEAEVIAERLRREIQLREVPFGISQLSVTASLGVALWEGKNEEWEDLLRRADAGMYLAKGSGRNRVEIFAS